MSDGSTLVARRGVRDLVGSNMWSAVTLSDLSRGYPDLGGCTIVAQGRGALPGTTSLPESPVARGEPVICRALTSTLVLLTLCQLAS
ncbi:MAG: hypothetical protein ACO3JL_19025, partial [Myxococcota bacterium]